MSPRYTDILIFLTCITYTAALHCLNCTNDIPPRYCSTVRKCNDGEVCFTKSHTSENGTVLFDTGCKSSQACGLGHNNNHGVDQLHHHTLCMECCSSPLCNNKGCSQSGYPSNRGPICFDCQNISDPTLCDRLKVCEVNQACYLQKEVESGNLHYTSGCINKQACTSSVDIFGKRNIDGCSKCCLRDLCNIQCK
ncbi:uncharacterized protein LOC134253092 [Saccostrea cucullata]|uniref:uncharacterized protein LOC134253092 n=1 Tax=Saccostrea cuccullata TaxID=36930 RepID=UPI002ED1F223